MKQLLLGTVSVAVLMLAACADDDPAARPNPTTTSAIDERAAEAADAAEAIEATTTPEPPPDADGDGIPDSNDDYALDPERWQEIEVTVECDLDDDFSPDETFVLIADDLDFTEVWEAEPPDLSCEASRASGELTEIEQAAFDASGYDDESSITTLYELCAVVDPDEDSYVSGDHSASPDQIDEINGVLTLCPDHPLADAFAATVERGEAEAELEAEGRLFYAGTYLVGDEIQPGTYAIEGEINDCYWEQQNSAGEIIDNNFLTSARRVEVTIQSTDYAFHSDGCGQWRPVE